MLVEQPIGSKMPVDCDGWHAQTLFGRDCSNMLVDRPIGLEVQIDCNGWHAQTMFGRGFSNMLVDRPIGLEVQNRLRWVVRSNYVWAWLFQYAG